jgi:hypothetical protein
MTCHEEEVEEGDGDEQLEAEDDEKVLPGGHNELKRVYMQLIN